MRKTVTLTCLLLVAMLSTTVRAQPSDIERQYSWDFTLSSHAWRFDLTERSAEGEQVKIHPGVPIQIRLSNHSGSRVDVYIERAGLERAPGSCETALPGACFRGVTNFEVSVSTQGWVPGEYYLMVGGSTSAATGIIHSASVVKERLEVAIPAELLVDYSDFPQGRRDELSRMVAVDSAVKEVAVQLRQRAAHWELTDIQRANFILSFVQRLDYTSDKVGEGYDQFTKFPAETLAERGGDCEDTAILYAALLQANGYDAVLMLPPQHAATGVAVAATGYSLEVNGKRYYYAETTGEGAPIGYLPPDYRNASIQTFTLGKAFIAGDASLLDKSLTLGQEALRLGSRYWYIVLGAAVIGFFIMRDENKPSE
jgi:hypothetical protein